MRLLSSVCRFSSWRSVGIVGLPNVGKSTLFNALTSSTMAKSSNFPFCTIEPNKAFLSVPDPRLKTIANIGMSKSVIPAQIELVDIAGLVRDASKGSGLGNKFLSHVRGVAGLVHVVRCFESADIQHVENRVDPVDDLEIILTELELSDQELLDRWSKSKKGSPAPTRLLDKPFIIACNVDEETSLRQNGENDLVLKVKQFAKAKWPSASPHVVSICSRLEAELGLLESAEERKEFLGALGAISVFNQCEAVINSVVDAMDLQVMFTVGPEEARAWWIPRRSAFAAACAGQIHSDIERGFIRCETVAYDAFVATAGQAPARLEGKNYLVQDGDVVHFRFNVSKSA